jgi:hypothetical protein
MEDREKDDYYFCKRNVFYTPKGQSTSLYRVVLQACFQQTLSFPHILQLKQR